MQNPFSPDKPLTEAQEKRVKELRTIRRNARKAARSGHPERRADARRALAVVGPMIAQVYRSAS